MKILWITNVELPAIAAKYNKSIVIGGWMEQMSTQLADMKDQSLYIASPSDIYYEDVTIDDITYSSFCEKSAEYFMDNLFNRINPDIIHIWGTEYHHSLSAVNAAKKNKMINRTVVSIQGLVSVYANHFFAGLPWNVVTHRTLKEWLGRSNIWKMQKEMELQGRDEIEVIKGVEHCIGRTDWDLACVKQINPMIQYHFCNETIRREFYLHQWSYEMCEKHTIFFSQSHYPIKGFHNLLEALSIIKKVCPNVKVRVIGNSILNKKTILQKIKQSSYQKYLCTLIEKYNLEGNVEWVGFLSAEEMVEQYCKANAFVCSSSIENSSNSIGEAMLLGVPVVASDVGGIKSLMRHEEEGFLYQETAPYMMADCIIRIFSMKEGIESISESARKRAKITHNPDNNLLKLLEVYMKIGGKYK